MKKFRYDCYFDSEGDLVEDFYINNMQVDEDSYYDELDRQEEESYGEQNLYSDFNLSGRCVSDFELEDFNGYDEIYSVELCGDCCDYEEVTEDEMIAELVDDILETNGCPECIENVLRLAFEIGEEQGWEKRKQFIAEINDNY